MRLHVFFHLVILEIFILTNFPQQFGLNFWKALLFIIIIVKFWNQACTRMLTITPI